MAAQYNRKDRLYQKAKDEGFRSRAAYKLQEIDAKYKIIKPNYKIIDLGAWPGGWLQVAGQACRPNGLVVGIDLQEIQPLGDLPVAVITGDAGDAEILNKAVQLAGSRFDLIISDMSPKLSGIKEADHAASVWCAELAVSAARIVLKNGGDLVIKVFKSAETDAFVKSSQALFNKLIREELDSTRRSSNEYYLIGRGFKGMA